MPIAHHVKPGPRRTLAAGLMIGMAGVLTGALLMLAGCGGPGPGSPATASHTQSAQQRARAVWLQFARCARSHGAPDFPDPQLDSQGRASFADDAHVKQEMGTSQVREACGPILGRRHGVPGFPDPRPDGTFALTPTQKGSPQLNNAVQACRQYSPRGGL